MYVQITTCRFALEAVIFIFIMDVVLQTYQVNLHAYDLILSWAEVGYSIKYPLKQFTR